MMPRPIRWTLQLQKKTTPDNKRGPLVKAGLRRLGAGQEDATGTDA